MFYIGLNNIPCRCSYMHKVFPFIQVSMNLNKEEMGGSKLNSCDCEPSMAKEVCDYLALQETIYNQNNYSARISWYKNLAVSNFTIRNQHNNE